MDPQINNAPPINSDQTKRGLITTAIIVLLILAALIFTALYIRGSKVSNEVQDSGQSLEETTQESTESSADLEAEFNAQNPAILDEDAY